MTAHPLRLTCWAVPLIVVLLTPWALAPAALAQAPPAPTVRLSGTVEDEATEARLSFASIAHPSGVGTATDEQGTFRLTIQRDETIHVTFVGYKDFYFRLPKGFTGDEYFLEVMLERDVVALRSTTVRPRTENDFKDEFMQLNVVTEEERNADDNVAKIREQGILGIVPQLDGFDNYRVQMAGPQNVTFFSTGPNKGLLRGIKNAFRRPEEAVFRRHVRPSPPITAASLRWRTRPAPADSLR